MSIEFLEGEIKRYEADMKSNTKAVKHWRRVLSERNETCKRLQDRLNVERGNMTAEAIKVMELHVLNAKLECDYARAHLQLCTFAESSFSSLIAIRTLALKIRMS
jgi:hypothetical protein